MSSFASNFLLLLVYIMARLLLRLDVMLSSFLLNSSYLFFLKFSVHTFEVCIHATIDSIEFLVQSLKFLFINIIIVSSTDDISDFLHLCTGYFHMIFNVSSLITDSDSASPVSVQLPSTSVFSTAAPSSTLLFWLLPYSNY